MARIKEVFGSHANLAHTWASGEYTYGRSGDRRMHFEGATLYSYGNHFPMAVLFTGKDGAGYALQNDSNYSPSTGKHMSLMRSAVRHKTDVLDVPTELLKDFSRLISRNGQELEAWEKSSMLALDSLYGHVLKCAKARIVDSHGKAKRARSYKQMHLNDIDRRIAELEALATSWGMVKPELEIDNILAETARERAEAAAKDKADRELKARQNEQAREQLKALPDAWRANAELPYYAAIEGMDNERPRQMQISHWDMLGGNTLLRRSIDGSEVETSRGARVPWLQALKLYTFAHRCKGKGWAPPPDVMCGPYRLTSIDADGNVIIGCHVLEMVEMQALAVREGVAL